MPFKLTPQQQATVTEVTDQTNSLLSASKSLVQAVRKHGVGSVEVKAQSAQARAVFELLLGAAGKLAGAENAGAAKTAINAVSQRLTDAMLNLRKADVKTLPGDAVLNQGIEADLDDVAKELRKRADASGQAQAYLFNGKYVVVEPGGDPKAAVTAFLTTREGPIEKLEIDVSELRYDLEKRARAAERELEYAKPPRNEAALIRDLRKANPNSPYFEGFFELNRPEELETLFNFYFEAAPEIYPRSATIKTDADAQRIALDNVRYAMRKRDNAAVDRVLKPLLERAEKSLR